MTKLIAIATLLFTVMLSAPVESKKKNEELDINLESIRSEASTLLLVIFILPTWGEQREI